MAGGDEIATFAGYELQERVGIGGMAEVFRATKVGVAGFRKEVALKRMLPQLSHDARFVAQFLAEARLSATFSHTNLVQVFDFGEAEGSYYLVMELVTGVDLARLIAAQGRLSPELVTFLGLQLCSALDFVHSATLEDGSPAAIVHRDITPGNVLISQMGNVKLADFGIAKARAQAVQTADGTIKGKLAYLSPEQARGDATDARTDLYSLGLVLFEAATGVRYLDADTEAQLLAMALQPPRRHPLSLVPELPSGLAEILVRALAANREDRYPSAQHLAAELGALASAAQLSQGQRALALLVQNASHKRSAAGLPPAAASSVAKERVPLAPKVHTEVLPPTQRHKTKRVALVGTLGALCLLGLVALSWQPTSEVAEGPVAIVVDADSRPTFPRSTRSALPPEHEKAPSQSATGISHDSPAPPKKRATPAQRPTNSTNATASPAERLAPREPESSPTAAAAPATSASTQALEESLAKVAALLKTRGLRRADVPTVYAALGRLQEGVSAGETSLTAVDSLRSEITALPVDRDFIATKLQRLNAAVSKQQMSGKANAALTSHIQAALSFSVTQRYNRANAELNIVADLLGEP